MLGALAYVAMYFIRIPIMPAAPFLKLDPKDVILAIGGFLYGPVHALFMIIVVAFAEMISVSESGWIGMLMNVISSVSFVCTAAIIYRLKRSLRGAVMGLIAGCIAMTSVMLLWNFIITPLYMYMGPMLLEVSQKRAEVAKMLLPVFLPFNLIKSSLNAAITMLLYKPAATALRRGKLYPDGEGEETAPAKLMTGVAVVSIFVIISIALVIMIIQGKI